MVEEWAGIVVAIGHKAIMSGKIKNFIYNKGYCKFQMREIHVVLRNHDGDA